MFTLFISNITVHQNPRMFVTKVSVQLLLSDVISISAMQKPVAFEKVALKYCLVIFHFESL